LTPEEMKRRTQRFALGVIELVERLPRTRTADVIARQLVRSGTSVGANYRASCRARSRAEFVAKMGVVEEETDETLYWIDLLVETGLIPREAVRELQEEGSQILSIVVASIRTSRGRSR
jgi:four helix bundle protein